jgi:hypothetical protein
MPVDVGVPLVLRAAPAVAGVATPGASASHTATIHFPADFTGEAIVRSSDGRTHGRWRAADGLWSITLPDSFYQVVAEPAGSFGFSGNGLFALVGADADVRL